MAIIPVPADRDLVRVLHVSQLFKEHLTDLILSVSRKAAVKGFSENVFDVFGYVDARDVAMLRLESRPIEQQVDEGAVSILSGAYTTPYREVTPNLLRAFDAGHLCVVKRAEIEILINAPGEYRQYPRFLHSLEEWKQHSKEQL
jgi:hypothetical protein